MSGATTLAAFQDDIAAWAVPSLAPLHIAAGLRAETARTLLQGRTAARAARLLRNQLGPVDLAALDPADAKLITGSLDTIVARAGCVWHATRVRALLRGADIALLVNRFGETARAAALRHAQPIDPAAATDDLAADIAQDGAHCIDAWIIQLPEAARSRMHLVRPAPDVTPDHLLARAKLVRHLALETTS